MRPLHFPVPKAAREICERLSEHGHGAWIVGGCVRDCLRAQLGSSDTRAVDWDIATSARPEQVQKLFRHVIPTGIEHGTVTVILERAHYEVTTLRADVGYSDGRRPDRVEFVDDIVADLARRDFTVNAIAYDVLHDSLIDPFDGEKDLNAKLLRAVGDAAQRFAEDGLRVLRAARFVATLGFSLDPATEAAIRPSLDSYRKVSAERIRDEWLKALKAEQPSLAFAVMRDHGLLEVSAPALQALHDAAKRPNQLDRSFAALDRAAQHSTANRACLQLACLLHALDPEPARAAKLADQLLHALRFSNQERETVRALIAEHRPAYQTEWSDADVRRWLSRVGRARTADLLEFIALTDAAADRPPQLNAELRRRAEQQLAAGVPLTLKDLAIGGRDLMSELGLPAGKQLGSVLEALLALTLQQPELNERRALLERAARLQSGSE